MSRTRCRHERYVVIDGAKALTEDDGHVDEVVAQRAAIGRRQFRGWCAPPRWIRRPREDVLGNRGPIE